MPIVFINLYNNIKKEAAIEKPPLFFEGMAIMLFYAAGASNGAKAFFKVFYCSSFLFSHMLKLNSRNVINRILVGLKR